MERRRRDGPCVKVGAAITDTSSLDVLLLALPPDQLQVGDFFWAHEAAIFCLKAWQFLEICLADHIELYLLSIYISICNISLDGIPSFQ